MLIKDADVATLDVTSLAPHAMAEAAQRVRDENVTVAANGVDSQESLQAAREAGFDLFRGQFFTKPRSGNATDGAAGRLAVLRLLGALQDPTVELPDLARLLAQDVGLTYRLLRYINSAFFGVRREVTSDQPRSQPPRPSQHEAVGDRDDARGRGPPAARAAHDGARPRTLLRADRAAVPPDEQGSPVHARAVSLCSTR